MDSVMDRYYEKLAMRIGTDEELVGDEIAICEFLAEEANRVVALCIDGDERLANLPAYMVVYRRLCDTFGIAYATLAECIRA
jgi:hypothetical protein